MVLFAQDPWDRYSSEGNGKRARERERERERETDEKTEINLHCTTRNHKVSNKNLENHNFIKPSIFMNNFQKKSHMLHASYIQIHQLLPQNHPNVGKYTAYAAYWHIIMYYLVAHHGNRKWAILPRTCGHCPPPH